MSFYYTDEEHLQVADVILLDQINSQHCIKVLRKKINDEVYLTNGRGLLALCFIREANPQKCYVQVSNLEQPYAHDKHFAIGISLLKHTDRLEWLVEKATELGVYEIFPLICKRTEKTSLKTERLRQITISAMLQSKQSYLPILHSPKSVEEVMNQTSTYAHKWIAHISKETPKTPLHELTLRSQTKNIYLIGPEGDFTAQEVALSHEKGFVSLSLGVHRLRSETAGLLVAAHYYQCGQN